MEDGAYHSILHTWTEASKCPACTTQIGGHLWVSTPGEIFEGGMSVPMYAGRRVVPYDRNNTAHFGIMSPVMNLNFNFDEYRYDTLLYHMQPFGRAEVMAMSEDEEENFGMGSLELYTKLDNYIQCQETSVSDYERNQYYLNLYEKEMKIAQDEDYATDDEDIFNVSDRNYYDKYSFKTNWADSWKESNIRPTGWFTLSTNSEK